MVRVAFVSLLIVGMVVGAAGAEDNENESRSSVITSDAAKASSTMMTTIVVNVVPIPVPTRKLSKKRKASNDNELSEDVKRLLRLLVFNEAVDLYRSMQQPVPDDAAFVDNDGRELQTVEDCVYKDQILDAAGQQVPTQYIYGAAVECACGGCLAFFTWGPDSYNDRFVFLSVIVDK